MKLIPLNPKMPQRDFKAPPIYAGLDYVVCFVEHDERFEMEQFGIIATKSFGNFGMGLKRTGTGKHFARPLATFAFEDDAHAYAIKRRKTTLGAITEIEVFIWITE